MSYPSFTFLFDSNPRRFIAINCIIICCVVIALFFAFRTFGQMSVLFDRDVNRNLNVALTSFDLDKELGQVMIIIHEKDNVLLSEPEVMLAGRQEVITLFDDIFRKVNLTRNYFAREPAYQALKEYRAFAEQRMAHNVEISQSVLRLDLLNQSFLKTLADMEVDVGNLIVDTVLAGSEPTGLHQINALIPFCREQILVASSIMDRAVTDLEPERIAFDQSVGEKTTLDAQIQSLAKTLKTLTSAHPAIATKVDWILNEIDPYLKTVHNLKEGIEKKLFNHGQLEIKQKALIEQQTKANREMADSLLQIGENAKNEMARAMKWFYLFAFVAMVVCAGSLSIAYLTGRQMEKKLAEKDATRLYLKRKLSQLIKEMSVLKKTDGEALARYKELEETVNAKALELNFANKELESIIAAMSHDLRTPLRGIVGFSHALRTDCGDVLDETGREYLDRIEEGGIKMGRTIDAILELSRLSRGEIKKEQVNLSVVAEGVVEELRKNHPEQVVEVRIAPGLTELSSALHIKAILENLLDNAWKFTSKEACGEIEFGREEKTGKFVYFVRDNGVGFHMAYSEKMFGLFQRLHSLEEYTGAGVGLALVQRLVRKHGGEVWAQGLDGEGATIYFTLS